MLSRYFTRLAAGTAAALALSGCMGDPTLSTAVPEEDHSVFTTGEKLTSPYAALFLSAYERSECADKYEATVSANTPAGALKRAFNRASGDKWEQLCLWAAFDPYKAVPQAGRYTIDPGTFLNDDQFAAQLYFSTTFKAPRDYKAWENERMQAALAAITAHPKIREAFEAWKHPADYENERDAHAQYRMKLQTLQIASDLIRESFGFAPIPVKLFGFDFEKYNVLGYYRGDTNTISINYASHRGASASFTRAMEVITEESKHSVDWAMADMYIKGEFGPGDIRAEHAAGIWLNNKEYIGQQSAWRFSITADPVNYVLTLGSPVFSAYKAQYIERNAKEYSKALTGDILQDLSCRNGAHPVKCTWRTALNLF